MRSNKQFRQYATYLSEWGIYLPAADSLLSAKEELNKIIDSFYSKSSMPVGVLVSGGIDSDFIASYLFENGYDFTPIAYKFLYNGEIKNDFDLSFLRCRPWGNKILYRELDIASLWHSDWFKSFFNDCHCPSPQLATQSFMVEDSINEGFSVIYCLSQPEIYRFDKRFYSVEVEKEYIVETYLNNRFTNLRVLVSPLSSSPEIFSACINFLENFMKDKEPWDSSVFKKQIYLDLFGISLTERTKLTGFENLDDLDLEIRKNIFDQFGYKDRRMFISLDKIRDRSRDEFILNSSLDVIPLETRKF